MTQSFETKPVEEARRSAQEATRNEIAPPHVRRKRSMIFQAGVIAASVLFGVLALLAAGNAYFPIDLEITRALQAVRAPWFLALMVAVSWPGFLPQAVLLTMAAGLALGRAGLRDEGLFTVLCAVGSQALNLGVKAIIARPRPAETLVDVFHTLTTYSFPSGHVMFYTGLFGFLLFLAYTLLKHSRRRAALLVFLGGMMALVAPSRIYLGGHWASDVVGAYLLGGLWLAAIVMLYRRRKSPRPDGT